MTDCGALLPVKPKYTDASIQDAFQSLCRDRCCRTKSGDSHS